MKMTKKFDGLEKALNVDTEIVETPNDKIEKIEKCIL